MPYIFPRAGILGAGIGGISGALTAGKENRLKGALYGAGLGGLTGGVAYPALLNATISPYLERLGSPKTTQEEIKQIAIMLGGLGGLVATPAAAGVVGGKLADKQMKTAAGKVPRLADFLRKARSGVPIDKIVPKPKGVTKVYAENIPSISLPVGAPTSGGAIDALKGVRR